MRETRLEIRLLAHRRNADIGFPLEIAGALVFDQGAGRNLFLDRFQDGHAGLYIPHRALPGNRPAAQRYVIRIRNTLDVLQRALCYLLY